jgi:hypothetical protein
MFQFSPALNSDLSDSRLRQLPILPASILSIFDSLASRFFGFSTVHFARILRTHCRILSIKTASKLSASMFSSSMFSSSIFSASLLSASLPADSSTAMRTPKRFRTHTGTANFAATQSTTWISQLFAASFSTSSASMLSAALLAVLSAHSRQSAFASSTAPAASASRCSLSALGCSECTFSLRYFSPSLRPPDFILRPADFLRNEHRSVSNTPHSHF